MKTLGTGNEVAMLMSNAKRRIAIKQANTVTDDAGGTSTSGYTTLYSCWAYGENMTTQEKLLYGIDGFQNAMKFILRYAESRTILIDQVVEYNDGGVLSLYEIKNVTLITPDYKRYQQIICQQFNASS